MESVHDRSDEASKRAWAEAAAWVVKLHGPGRDAALEAGWKAWLEENPDHAFAWEIASETWTTSHDVAPKLALPPPTARTKRTPRTWTLAVIGSACLAVLLAAFALHWLSGPSVATEVGEQRSVNLSDGTRIQLNTETDLKVDFDDRVRRVVLRSGEAYFAVAHERRPFVVMAGNRKVIAIGTSFVVRKSEQIDSPLTVTLIEGRVAVAKEGAADTLPPDKLAGVTILKSGERLRLKSDGQTQVDLPSMERATGWMRGQVIFDHTTLSEAVAELNRYGPQLRLFVAPSAAQIKVGGSFRIGDSESFARAVAETYNLSLTRRRNQLILRRLDSSQLRET